MLEHINVQHQLDFQQVTSYTSQHLLNLSLGGSAAVAQQDAWGSDLPWEGTSLGVILEHAHGRYSQHYSLGDRSNAATNYQSIVATCYSKTLTIFVRKNADKRIKTRQEKLEDGEQKNNWVKFSVFLQSTTWGWKLAWKSQSSVDPSMPNFISITAVCHPCKAKNLKIVPLQIPTPALHAILSVIKLHWTMRKTSSSTTHTHTPV